MMLLAASNSAGWTGEQDNAVSILIGVLKRVQNTKMVVILFLGFYYMTTAGQLPLLSGATSQDVVASIKTHLDGVAISFELMR